MTRQELLSKWKLLDDPKPSWEAFKRLVGVSRGDVTKALDLWQKTRSR